MKSSNELKKLRNPKHFERKSTNVNRTFEVKNDDSAQFRFDPNITIFVDRISGYRFTRGEQNQDEARPPPQRIENEIKQEDENDGLLLVEEEDSQQQQQQQQQQGDKVVEEQPPKNDEEDEIDWEKESELRALSTLSKDYNVNFKDILELFQKVSFDLDDLKEYLDTSNENLLWTSEQDNDLLNGDPTAIKYLTEAKGEDRIAKRRQYLMEDITN